ncbi:Uncharacterised protein [Amycolatopsis camponoti]|uniref:Uncharacterized protein n=1 Tax=Amycolatopsis camponoti TaxID=2606593 RepID=A0A6I8LNZ9_9PSEU|nr:DUF6218 family protein [Amycolatopsis camponoti]VVJ17246.1 Uncharacterised protein [Amycolatopsis camponoti]
MTDPATIEPLEELTALWAPGSAILCVGAGDHEIESVATWHVSPAGDPTGAWIYPASDVFGSQDAARRVLAFVERRAIAAVHPQRLQEWLDQLTATAKVDVEDGWWKRQLFSPVDAFHETTRRRQQYAVTVEAARENSKTITPLEWTHDLPDDAEVQDFASLQRIAGISSAPGTPVVSEILPIARTLRWLVSLWAETEQVKNRRRYVRAEHGDPDPLPPQWLAAVQAGSTNRLPL